MLKIPSLIPFLKRSSLVVLGLVVFVIVLGALYFIDKTYRIINIVVSNNQKEIPIAGTPAIEGRYIFLTSEQEIADTITRTNPTIKSVTVAKQYPDTIKLSVTRYQRVANLKSNEGYFLLGDEGRILGKTKELEKSKLPVITYYQSIPFSQYQAGAQLPFEDIRDSIYFLGKLRAMGIVINSIDIAGFHMLGLYTEEKKYFFSSEKERAIQLYHMEQAIKRFKTEKKYKSIDVRFDKPVITF
ncbi:hypothetical protein BH09PAT2_BH09PAT2_09880 [soil metagenome]